MRRMKIREGFIVKRKYALWAVWLMACCFLCSCGADKPEAAGKVPRINCEQEGYHYIINGEDGYYLFCNGLTAYWDGNLEHQATPLCKRPDCSHRTETCSAFVQDGKEKLFYADGSLYLFSGFPRKDPVTHSEVFPFWRIAADGSAKDVVFTVEDIPLNYTVFDGFVYYKQHLEDENGKMVDHLFRRPLQGGEAELIWRSSLQADGLVGTLQMIGDLLYFEEEGYDPAIDIDDPALDLDQVVTKHHLYTYHPGTGELTKNPEFDGKEGDQIYIRNLYDGQVFYAYGQDREKELWYKPIEGGEAGTCLGLMPPYVNRADSDYAYTYCRREPELGINSMKVYDHGGGKLLQELQMPHMDGWLEWVPATEEYVFGYYTGLVSDDGSKWDKAIVVLERDKLAEGKAEMVRIMTTE